MNNQEPLYKICKQCGNLFEKPHNYSMKQWNSKIYCSNRCLGLSKRINDEHKNRAERFRRKHGVAILGSDECKTKISETTKKGMAKESVRNKLRKRRKPLSDEHKKKLSDSLIGKMPKNLTCGQNGMYSHINKGFYNINGKEIYFRSKWEANYALYLDFLIKIKYIERWEYEKDTFIFHEIISGCRSYKPDFKLYFPNGGIVYHEIKGYMDKRSITKLNRMKKYYPNIILKVIKRKEYYSLIREYKSLNFF